MNQLEQICGERVSVLLQEVPGVIENNSSKMIETKGLVDVGLGFEIIPVVSMPLVKFVQQSLI